MKQFLVMSCTTLIPVFKKKQDRNPCMLACIHSETQEKDLIIICAAGINFVFLYAL